VPFHAALCLFSAFFVRTPFCARARVLYAAPDTRCAAHLLRPTVGGLPVISAYTFRAMLSYAGNNLLRCCCGRDAGWDCRTRRGTARCAPDMPTNWAVNGCWADGKHLFSCCCPLPLRLPRAGRWLPCLCRYAHTPTFCENTAYLDDVFFDQDGCVAGRGRAFFSCRRGLRQSLSAFYPGLCRHCLSVGCSYLACACHHCILYTSHLWAPSATFLLLLPSYLAYMHHAHL